VRGQKRRELLALLLESKLAGRREVSKLDLLENLYPSINELQASTALKDLVYALRELHGPAYIQTTDGGYALGDVGSDAEAFLQSGDTRLWRGSYLEGLSLEGDATVREA
jgi:two-component SAPR family response regulator